MEVLRKTILLGFVFLLALLSSAAYEIPSQSGINMTLSGGYVAPDQSDVNLTLSDIEISSIANEVTGRSAIEQGISAVLSKSADKTDYRVYLRRSNGSQETGVFDKYVESGSQRWVFNYITEGENFTSMLNLTPTVYVWEGF
ncbi:MAG: hypothetical protein MI923_05110, partial [Phycisphaerales bacterium]|nr:hypothetical protein [Phycisphaerales bacterium]